MKFRLGQIFIFAAVLMIASVGMVGCDTEEIQYEEAESRIQYWLPLNATVSKSAATADLAYMMNVVETNHCLAANGIPEDVNAQFELEAKRLSANPTVCDVWTSVGRIMSRLSDSQSNVTFVPDVSETLDAQVELRSEDVYITIGNMKAKLISINDVSVDQMWNKFKEQSSYDNLYQAKLMFESALSDSAQLTALGAKKFGQNSVSVRYEYNGKETKQSVSFSRVPVKPSSYSDYDFVYYEIDRPNNVALLTLNKCLYNDVYTETLRDFFADVKEEGIDNIAIDLRGNSSGSDEAAYEFMRYIDVKEYFGFNVVTRGDSVISQNQKVKVRNDIYSDLAYDGDVYVLTSDETANAAVTFSVLLQDNGIAKVIGAVPSSSPSHYDDVTEFRLPYTGLIIKITHTHFIRPDLSKVNQTYQKPDYQTDSQKAFDKLYEVVGKKRS